MQHFQARVKYYILQEPSASVPHRLNWLLTFASTKKVKRKVKAIERERKVVNRCARKAMAWNNKPGFMQHYSGEQYLELSRVISDPKEIHTRDRKAMLLNGWRRGAPTLLQTTSLQGGSQE